MKKKQIDEVALVNRLFSYYRDKGESSEAAVSRIENELGNEYSYALNSLKELVTPGAVSVNGSASPILKSLTNDVQSDQESLISELFVELQKVSPGFKACLRYLSTLFLYPAIILFIATGIYGTYKLFVYPQLYKVFGELDMPSLTRIIFSDAVAVALLILFVLIVIFLVWNLMHVRSSFKSFKPNHSAFARFIGTAQHQSYFLYLVYLGTLLKCGTSPRNALEKSESYAKLSQIEVPAYRHHRKAFSVLKHADTDTLLSEVEFQYKDSLAEIENTLVAQQEKMLIILQLFVYVFVGYLIVAMYLPIFKLAAVF